MMAINHAVSGAIIGVSVTNPLLAVPLAIASQFVLDAVPHYDPTTGLTAAVIGSKKFFREQILINGLLCFGLVLMLAIFQQKHWLLAAVCAFAAASPDLLSLPRFLSVKKTGKDILETNHFWKFHHAIQWRTSPRLLWLELVWLAGSGALLLKLV